MPASKAISRLLEEVSAGLPYTDQLGHLPDHDRQPRQTRSRPSTPTTITMAAVRATVNAVSPPRTAPKSPTSAPRSSAGNCRPVRIAPSPAGTVSPSTSERQIRVPTPAGDGLDHGRQVRGPGLATCDGRPFARDRIICVVINWRVGAEGFLYLGKGTANLGFLDQSAALHWVRMSGPNASS